jgi:hypothetical protein
MPQIAGFRGALQVPADPKPGLAGLTRDPSRSMYRYHQIFPGPGRSLTRKSLLCGVQLTPYTDNVVRPHEHATPALRDAHAARIRQLGAHVQPVLMGFRDPSTEIERLSRKHENMPPVVDVTVNGIQHKVWRISEAETIGAMRRYFAPKKLHILEGHDLYEAMLGYRDELAAKHAPPMYSSANYGLACLTSLDDPALATAPRHRIVRKTGKKRDDALAAVGKQFIVDKLAGAAKDVGKQFAALADTVAHQPAFIAVFAGDQDAYKLTLSPEVSPVAEGVSIHRALQKLEPVVMQFFIDRAFPGATTESTTDAAAALESGGDVVMITRPLSVEAIAHVDELGGMLPAGSTAFHPPLLPNVVGLVIDPDEDLV